LVAKDAWIDLHTPTTNNHDVVHYQEEKKNLLAGKRNERLFHSQGRSSKAT